MDYFPDFQGRWPRLNYNRTFGALPLFAIPGPLALAKLHRTFGASEN